MLNISGIDLQTASKKTKMLKKLLRTSKLSSALTIIAQREQLRSFSYLVHKEKTPNKLILFFITERILKRFLRFFFNILPRIWWMDYAIQVYKTICKYFPIDSCLAEIVAYRGFYDNVLEDRL